MNILLIGEHMSDRHVLPPYSLRMPTELREDLEALAKLNKRSLNAEIVARLERSIDDLDELGFSDRRRLSADADDNQPVRASRGIDEQRLIELAEDRFTDEAIARIERSLEGGPYPTWAGNRIAELRISRDMTFADCFDWSRDGNVIRLRHMGSTHDAHDQLLTVLATLENIESVTLAVRDGYANLSALSIVIRTETHTYLADTTALTTERPPRESEVRDVIWALDVRGLLGGAVQFRTDHVKQTDSLAPAKAVAAIEEGDKLQLGIKTLQQFLCLFHRKEVPYTEQELLRFFAD